MSNKWQVVAFVACLFMAQRCGRAADDPKEELQGAWQAQSIEADGQKAPEHAVKSMKFTFQKDKLLIKGNFENKDREDECSYVLDATASPKHLDFTPKGETKAIQAIYELKDGELKLCMRHAISSEGRPTEFATKSGAKLVLVVFKQEKP